jgi:hypothetical protein
MTLHSNTDCPRCGADLGNVYAEPDNLLHCPACRGALVVCGRMEDGGIDRASDIHVFAWFAPTDSWMDPSAPCDCDGCELRRGEGG